MPIVTRGSGVVSAGKLFFPVALRGGALTLRAMAQLKSSNSEIRSKQIIVRVTPTERKRLEREAKAAKVLLSQWMRRKLLDTPA